MARKNGNGHSQAHKEQEAVESLPKLPAPTATSEPAYQDPVDIAAWRRPMLVPLISGLWVEMRYTSLITLVKMGRIHNPLLSAAQRIIDGDEKTPAKTEKSWANKTDEEIAQAKIEYYAVLDALIMASVLRPRIVETLEEEASDEQAVFIGHLMDYDKIQILAYTRSTVAYLDSFRRVLAGQGAGRDGSEVSPASV